MAIPAVVGKSSRQLGDASNPPSRRARKLLVPLAILLVFSVLRTSQSMLAVRRVAVTKLGSKYYIHETEAEKILSIPSTDDGNSPKSLRKRILSDDATFDNAEPKGQEENVEHNQEERVSIEQQRTGNTSTEQKEEENAEEEPAAVQEKTHQEEVAARSETSGQDESQKEDEPKEQTDFESPIAEEQQQKEENALPEERQEQHEQQQQRQQQQQEQQQQKADSEPPKEEPQVDATTEHKKPRFILHVGPMKTGTSSLQADLDWLLGDQLEQDGWMYVKSESPFNDIPTDDPEIFLQRFKEEADKLLPLNKNVIRSREQYSDYFSERPWMYERLKDLLSDWDVEVVAGYRTYDGWLVSFWYQAMRMPWSDMRNPEERKQNPWRKDNGELFWIEPLFPNFFNFWKNRKRFTDAVVETAGPVFPVKIYDVRGSKGARSAFLCDALGEGAAPVSCAESLRLDRENPPLEVNKSNVKEVQYDAIALGAVEKGMVDEKQFLRSDIVDAIVARQEEELQKTVNDFPLICPDEATYQEFWNITSKRDVLCMPEKYEADPDYETKFREMFQKSVDKKKFCRVDVDAVLADTEWQQFFAKYAPPQQVESQ